ncbi:HTH domain-containing protein [Patescibacteria group bacterium]|nr:MAG: HTH domain-containing protein [Patescibacteria group bacterium]
MPHWNQLLRSLDFSESEAAFYLAALEAGSASAQELAKKAGVSRVTAYAAIESLTKRGLMSAVIKSKRALWSAESPERLISFFRSQLAERQTTLQELESSLGELLLLRRGERPFIRVFEGNEAVNAFYDDLISSGADLMLEIGNLEAIQGVIPLTALKPYKKRLDKAGIKVKAIYLTTKDFTPRPTTELRYLPSKLFSFNGDIATYKNRVALLTFRGKVVVVLIESEELAETARAFFQLAWDSAIFEKGSPSTTLGN